MGSCFGVVKVIPWWVLLWPRGVPFHPDNHPTEQLLASKNHLWVQKSSRKKVHVPLKSHENLRACVPNHYERPWLFLENVGGGRFELKLRLPKGCKKVERLERRKGGEKVLWKRDFWDGSSENGCLYTCIFIYVFIYLFLDCLFISVAFIYLPFYFLFFE